MVDLVIVYWRDIPAQVLVGRGRKAEKRILSERFEKAIDRAAMKSGADETDAYLEEWRKSEARQVEGDAANVANDWLTQLENDYPNDRLRELINNGGREV